MKFTRTIIAIFFLLTIQLSCKKNNDTIEHNHFETAVEKSNLNLDNTKWIVVLPGLGCMGCIQEAELFMKDNINNKNILFVLTKIESLKMLQNKIGVKVKTLKNVYIDRSNIFEVPTSNGIYPCIIKIESGNLKTHEFQSPRNGSAFQTLKASLVM